MDRETAASLVDALSAQSGIVAAVGAGGKKSALNRLVQAHLALGTRRILLTSTVQIAAPPGALGLEALPIGETPARDGAFFLPGPPSGRGRFAGVPAETIQTLNADGGFDVCLVKADGARMRMIKAPAEHEPALPEGVTTVLPVVSARVFGRPLTEKLAHRPERLTALVDCGIGTAIAPLHVARLLASPDGALRRTGDAEVVPVINMVDDEKRLTAAHAAASTALALTDRFERVVLAAMTGEQPLIDVVTR